MSLSRRFERKHRPKPERVIVSIAECEPCDKWQLERRTGSDITGSMVCDGCGARIPITKWLGKSDPTAPDPKTEQEWVDFLAERTAEFNTNRKAQRGCA